MVIHTLEKTVTERKTITLDANGLCPSGVTVSDFVATSTVRSSGASNTDIFVDDEPAPSANVVNLTFAANQAADGESYLVKCQFTLSNSDIKEVYLILNALNIT